MGETIGRSLCALDLKLASMASAETGLGPKQILADAMLASLRLRLRHQQFPSSTAA